MRGAGLGGKEEWSEVGGGVSWEGGVLVVE